MAQYSGVVAILLTAGVGNRLASCMPKQYIKIGNVTLLAHNILLLEKSNVISAIQVVIHQDHIDLYKQEILNLPLQSTKLLPVVIGGNTRQESSRLGLQAIQDIKPKYVIIHDTARPFYDENLLNKLIEELKDNKAVIPVCSIYDTIKGIDREIVAQTLKRDNIYLAQTPQAFDYSSIMIAHQKCQNISCTDDAEVCENADIKVKTILSSRFNFKITDAHDLEMAKIFMHKQYETRVGIGFDVHKFENQLSTNGQIFLGGVEIPHNYRIIAHSDGDVVLHALCDALLGSIGAGDIGVHFPPTDDQWKDVRSVRFIEHTLEMLRHKNATIINVDIIIIGETPKINPYRLAMQNKLSEILSISIDRINIKATTTEKMGFTGRNEGIAAQVIISINI
ncbi:Bifunctional enzyme IspD/IspF [Rickettsiales bacterium Ac37b]|nr:Bifunctional enzyme IspD/IspF [Rickettsiales bacterium Ac37b]